MKHKNYQQFTLVVLSVLIISVLFSGCHRVKRQKDPIVVAHPFENCNWTFKEEVMDLYFDITDTITPYRIEFMLTYDSTLNKIDELPVTITLGTPDGMESYVTSSFNFDRDINKAIVPTGRGSECAITLVAFPKKKFNQAGKYHINFYRKAAKYDNYGMNCLTMKVVPLKDEK